jgi:hypothetical protein
MARVAAAIPNPAGPAAGVPILRVVRPLIPSPDQAVAMEGLVRVVANPEAAMAPNPAD